MNMLNHMNMGFNNFGGFNNGMFGGMNNGGEVFTPSLIITKTCPCNAQIFLKQQSHCSV